MKQSLHHPAALRWPSKPVVLALVGVALAIWPTVGHAADDLRVLEVNAQNVRSSVGLIASDLRTAIARERQYPLDRRFVEANLAYERGNLNMATVQLMDLVYNSEFQKRRDYYDALYMLGNSLYRMKNWKAAKKYLDSVLKSRGQRKHFQEALRALVDISIRLRRFEEVEGYAQYLSAIPPSARLSGLLYQFGRSFFAARKFERAATFLVRINMGDRRWAAAHFYLGAIAVSRGKLDDAVREFRDVVSAGKSTTKEGRPPQVVLDYANLGLARIYLQRGNATRLKVADARKPADKARLQQTMTQLLSDAAFHYQSVDRNSPVYEAALFEMAASFVAAGRPKKALEALDILLLTVADDQVAVEAAVLRGRINLLSKKYDAADLAYKDVVERYSAVSGEMARFAASNDRLEQFFSWLLNRGADNYTVVRPVSERVVAFIEKDEDMGRVIELFDEMAAEKRDVTISVKLAATISAALKQGSRLDMFPELKDGWLKLLENENTVVIIGDRVVELLRKYAAPVLNDAERRQTTRLRLERARLMAAFVKIPPTAKAHILRHNRVSAAYNDLGAQISLLKSALGSLRDQILAIEKMLSERLYGTEGLVLSKAREAKIRAGLQQEKDELRRVFRLVDSLATDVEIKNNTRGPNDAVGASEANVRGALLATQRAEQQLYATALNRVRHHTSEAARLRVVRASVDETLLNIANLFRQISDRAGARTVGITKVLEQEKNKIASYKVAVNAYEEQSRRLARTVGYAMIRKAQERLSDVVLEADLGLVDVAWQRKKDKANEIRSLQDERAAKVKTLQNVLEALSEDGDVEEEP